jgi:hypothetical protein
MTIGARALMYLTASWTRISLAIVVAMASLLGTGSPTPTGPSNDFLDTHLLVTWYGNPRSQKMGVLGEQTGGDRAAALRRQAAAYASVTAKRVIPAYHLVAVVALSTPGADGKCRRQETPDVIESLLREAREHGFKLVLDVQPGRSAVEHEVQYLARFLAEPDVYLALDPEYGMGPGQVPGCQIGSMDAAEVNSAIDHLERLITINRLPPKVLIVHQFTLAMLPDKEAIRSSPMIDLVLNMDGFGSQALKLASYRAIVRQRELEFAGIKLFYRLDTQLLTPEQVMALRPAPSVVVYQ